ncbi:EAL domain-containing protein [Salinarimonas sp.]|uniref:EAL domain-containing protein n=1 Tax=Salinarimonas sp. TaxID=2766526 RepID=UPI0035B51A69
MYHDAFSPSVDRVGPAGCAACAAAPRRDFAISMAFQPIVDVETARPYAYEALVRDRDGAGGAARVLSRVEPEARYAFDQACRVRAVTLAAALGLAETGALLSINFLPNAVYEPRTCIRRTLAAARRVGFPLDRLMFEVSESERVADDDHLAHIVASYREMGFVTAIDDFGAGHSGLALLARFRPDVIKLDMALVRDIDADPARRTIVRAMVGMTRELGVRLVAEGIETRAESEALARLGVRLQQGYRFARPAFEALPRIDS